MRIVMMAQEEPVYMGPYLARVMRARAKDVGALAIAPRRSVAGKETDDVPADRWGFFKVPGFWPGHTSYCARTQMAIRSVILHKPCRGRLTSRTNSRE